MLWLIFLCAFITVLCIAFLLLHLMLKERLEIQKRLKIFAAPAEKAGGLIEGTLTDRIIKPFIKNANGFINRVTPKNYFEQMEKRLKEAGSPMNVSAGGVIFAQIGLMAAAAVSILYVWAAFRPSILKILIVILLMTGMIYIFPKLYLKQKIQQRQKEIEKSLPDVIDLLTVSIEAGLSFDGAMAKLVEKMSGVLVQEFAVVLKEMRVGVAKRDAFKSLVERVPVPNLITFVGAIMQADQLGVSVGNVLRIQSSLTRQKRRQKAQETAMKAPIKMLLPMVFFILPTIFIVLLGPVVIKIIEVFG